MKTTLTIENKVLGFGNRELQLWRSFRNGLTFDGINDVVLVNGAPNLSIVNPSFTAAFAIKANDTITVQNIVSKGFGNARQYNITIYNNTFLLRYGNGSTAIDYTITIPYSSNELNYIVWVKPDNDANNAQVYVNNVLIPHTVLSNTLNFISANTGRVQIGDFPDGYYTGVAPFNGIIYDIKLFNTNLDISECTQLWKNRGEFVPISKRGRLVLDLRFDQKQDFYAPDISSFANHGTLTNYTVGDVTLGIGNKWIDEQGNPILI